MHKPTLVRIQIKETLCSFIPYVHILLYIGSNNTHEFVPIPARIRDNGPLVLEPRKAIRHFALALLPSRRHQDVAQEECKHELRSHRGARQAHNDDANTDNDDGAE